MRFLRSAKFESEVANVEGPEYVGGGCTRVPR